MGKPVRSEEDACDDLITPHVPNFTKTEGGGIGGRGAGQWKETL